MNITKTRGDDNFIKFKRLNKTTKEVITEKPDKMYFTVKKNCCDSDAIIQKTLDNGITYDEESNIYTVEIPKKDTEEMLYGSYVYDVEVIMGKITKTILLGDFNLAKEVTHTCNEV